MFLFFFLILNYIRLHSFLIFIYTFQSSYTLKNTKISQYIFYSVILHQWVPEWGWSLSLNTGIWQCPLLQNTWPHLKTQRNDILTTKDRNRKRWRSEKGSKDNNKKKYTEKILKKKEKKARARPVVVQPWFSVNRGQESQKADILSRKKMDRLERDAKKNGWRLVQPDSCALRV